MKHVFLANLMCFSLSCFGSEPNKNKNFPVQKPIKESQEESKNSTRDLFEKCLKEKDEKSCVQEARATYLAFVKFAADNKLKKAEQAQEQAKLEQEQAELALKEALKS